jgi:uncharacterized protein Veg
MSRSALLEIKRSMETHVGQKIMLRANGGRKKTIERSGVLEETYPSVFVVKLDEENHNSKRVSYSYVDILTESVEITVCNESGQVRITCVQH